MVKLIMTNNKQKSHYYLSSFTYRMSNISDQDNNV